jgi:hypothetical protein
MFTPAFADGKTMSMPILAMPATRAKRLLLRPAFIIRYHLCDDGP